ncbi:MAG: hypothetical protein P8Z30_07840 [Acidobacteriota bacterium]
MRFDADAAPRFAPTPLTLRVWIIRRIEAAWLLNECRPFNGVTGRRVKKWTLLARLLATAGTAVARFVTRRLSRVGTTGSVPWTRSARRNIASLTTCRLRPTAARPNRPAGIVVIPRRT